MAEPAAALGLPLRLLAEAEGVSAAQVIPDHDRRRLPRPRDAARRSPSGCRGGHLRPRARARPSTCTRSRPTGIAVRPGPEALVHAQDKGVMRERLAELGVPCPRNAVVAIGRRGRGVRLPVRAQDHPRRVRRQGRLGRPRGRRLRRGRSRPPRRPASGCWPRSSSTSAASCPRWSPGRRAARPRRTRSSPATQLDGICHEVIAPAPDLDPELAGAGAADRAADRRGARRRPAILAVELFETRDGRVLVNELAMRPHNTGHWSQDGAVTASSRTTCAPCSTCRSARRRRGRRGR